MKLMVKLTAFLGQAGEEQANLRGELAKVAGEREKLTTESGKLTAELSKLSVERDRALAAAKKVLSN